MKDEIKEKFYSLEELKRTIDCYDGYSDNEEVYYFIGALRFAYDYITNLQEENERLKQSILNAIDKMNSEMVIINDRGYYYTDISALEDILQINDKDFIDYKSRNEKAIEYIKSLCYIESKNEWFTYGDDLSPEHIVNILKGSDEE